MHCETSEANTQNTNYSITMKLCSFPRESILFDMPAQGFCVLDYVDP